MSEFICDFNKDCLKLKCTLHYLINPCYSLLILNIFFNWLISIHSRYIRQQIHIVWCNSFSRPPEPQPLPDVLCKDPRQALLHGGPLRRSHENMDGRDRDGSWGLHAVHELRWRTIGARWRRLQTPDRTAGRLQTTQTCYSQLEEKLCFVTSFFVFWRYSIYSHGCADARPLEVFRVCLDETTERAEPAGGGSVAIDENAFLPSEISLSCSFSCLDTQKCDFYLLSKWFVFPSWGKCQMTLSRSGITSNRPTWNGGSELTAVGCVFKFRIAFIYGHETNLVLQRFYSPKLTNQLRSSYLLERDNQTPV